MEKLGEEKVTGTYFYKRDHTHTSAKGAVLSASVIINADDFSAAHLTFENTTGDAPQALAINVSGDRASFKNCRFLGGQDTFLSYNSKYPQSLYKCYIEGVVDFIFYWINLLSHCKTGEQERNKDFFHSFLKV